MTVILSKDYTDIDSVIFYDATNPKLVPVDPRNPNFKIQTHNLEHLCYITPVKGKLPTIFVDFTMAIADHFKIPAEKRKNIENIRAKDHFFQDVMKKNANGEMIVKYFDSTNTVTVDEKKYQSAALASLVPASTLKGAHKGKFDSTTTDALLKPDADHKFVSFKPQTQFEKPMAYFTYLKGGETVNIVSIVLQTKEGYAEFKCAVAPRSLQGRKNRAELTKHLAAAKAQSNVVDWK